jgi:hypothetical protein
MLSDVGGLPKEELKNTSYVEPIAKERELAKSGQLDGALQNLLSLEKTARLVCHSQATYCMAPEASCGACGGSGRPTGRVVVGEFVLSQGGSACLLLRLGMPCAC